MIVVCGLLVVLGAAFWLWRGISVPNLPEPLPPQIQKWAFGETVSAGSVLLPTPSGSAPNR